jgi:hypothetical protein
MALNTTDRQGLYTKAGLHFTLAGGYRADEIVNNEPPQAPIGVGSANYMTRSALAMVRMAEMYAGGAMDLVISEGEVNSPSNLGYHSSLALEYAALWDARAINNGLNRFPRGGRYIRIDNLIRGDDNLRTLILTEVDVHNSALKDIEAVSASMSSVFGGSNFDRAYQARNCIDGFSFVSLSDVCRTAANDSNPWILIDYGNDKALDDVMMIRVSSTIKSGNPLQDYAIRAIQGARIAVTKDTMGDEVVWSSKFDGSTRRFVFENEQDSGVTRAKIQKENECRALSKFCSDGDRLWPDTPSFEYFGGSEVTPATCDFALAKCHEDAGENVEARLHYIKAGGLVGAGKIETGAATYPQRLAEAAAALGALYVKVPSLPPFLPGVTPQDSARRWYAQALALGWEPPKSRCIWGHRHGFAENGTEVDANGPASWNGMCHSRWDTCDPMSSAILDSIQYAEASRAFNSPLFPVGSVCTAVCLGDELGTVDDAEKFFLRSDFTCGADGVWKGELLCPDTSAAANAGQLGYGVGETSPRSIWRADNLLTIQPRWKLSAVPLRIVASAVTKVECEWVDTQAIHGTHVWVTFAPPDSNFKSDGDELDMNFDIEHAPVVKVYSTVYTDTKSIVEYKEL